ncbi:hypothetical protein [Arthrobacter sp. CG_A4]|nr:hypothetical protein [Arthrobacter sp. CG_A4]
MNSCIVKAFERLAVFAYNEVHPRADFAVAVVTLEGESGALE